MVSIQEMELMLEELAEELPEQFYKELNGGIILLPQSKMHDRSNANDLYILGEYYRGGNMGRYIAIYYGSFFKLYGNLDDYNMQKELRKTLRHEFRHHLESLAGERDLEIEDEKYISDYMKRYGIK